MSAPQFSSKMLETLKRTWLLYESITYSTTVFWNICLEKANVAHFVSRPLGEKLVKHLFWKKWWILKTLKLQKLKNASRPLGEKLPKDLFWQNWRLLNTLKQKLENAKFVHLVSFPLWWKTTKTLVWTKLEVFQSFEAAASNIWKGKLCRFCKPPDWWKNYFFWQK